MNTILAGVLRIIRLLLDFISEVIFSFLYGVTEPLPPLSSPLLLHSATTLAKQIRERKITAVQCMTVIIQRIEEINPVLNCVVDTRFNEALREAGEVDELLDSVEVGGEEERELLRSKPFLGVPFSCKDCFAAEDMAHTVGLYSRRNVKADYDAPVVARMKAAGGILVCVSNVSELCMWMESSNTVTGRSNNPYHTGRTCGGSSGGEGSLIGGGGTPVGIGSDVGGSIRMPAFFNGIFGHKPTAGLVPNTGQLPPAWGRHDVYLCTGPLCRAAEDLAPLLAVLAGPESAARLRLDELVRPDRLRVHYMEDDGGSPLVSPVHPELRTAMRNFLAGFRREFGVSAERVAIPELYHSINIWMAGMKAETAAPSFCSHLAGDKGGEINPWWELVKWSLRCSNHTLPALGLGLLEKGLSSAPGDHVHFLELADRLRDRLNGLLGDDGVLVYPSHSTPAPYHSQPILKTFNFAYTAVFNILGLPVTQVPLGLGSWGVPLGVQVVAGAGQDRLGLEVARQAERMFGGWVPPSPVK